METDPGTCADLFSINKGDRIAGGKVSGGDQVQRNLDSRVAPNSKRSERLGWLFNSASIQRDDDLALPDLV